MGSKGDGRSDTARSKVSQYKADSRGKPSPIPLESCPWCNARFTPDSFSLVPDANEPRNLRVVCTSFDCDFNGDRALPIVAVDEAAGSYEDRGSGGNACRVFKPGRYTVPATPAVWHTHGRPRRAGDSGPPRGLATFPSPVHR